MVNWKTLRRAGLVLLALSAVLMAPTSALADPMIRVQSVSVTDNGVPINSFFDVFVELSPGDPVIDVASFTLDLSVPGSMGVTFTNILTSEQAGQPYIFPGGTGFVANGFQNFSDTVFPSLSLLATDSTILLAGQPFGPGPASVGLARVFFEVQTGFAPEVVPVTLGPLTGISDPDGNPLVNPDNFINGTITVREPLVEVIPEPASAILLALGGAAGAAGYWRRRKA
jgi:hypothetical protein